MKLDELKKLIKKGESEQIEFKRSTGQRSEAAKTVCAMLNGIGGFILFGVTDDGNPVGQQVTTRTIEDITNEIQRIEPPVFPDIETIMIDISHSIIILRISGGGGPYTYDGRSYTRHGPTTRIMPQKIYEKLLLERMHAHSRWENQPARNFSIKDLDTGEIIRTIDEAIRRNRLDDPGTRNIKELLLGLGLIEKGNILNAAVVLFGKTDRLLSDYIQCNIRLARFRGKDKTEFLDNRQYMGNAFVLFQKGQNFLRDHLPVAGRILPGVIERVDEPLYPTEAMREALANAICHRDYSIAGGAVGVAIYDNRLEISNTGSLPFGLTLIMIA